MPHTHRETAEFITRLSSMVAIGQARNTTETALRVKTGSDIDPSVLKAPPFIIATNVSDQHIVANNSKKDTTTTNNFDKYTVTNNPDKHTVFNRSDKQNSITGISADNLTVEVASLAHTDTQAKMDGLAKVSAIDGSGSISATSKVQVLLLYFVFNIGLTLYNKAVMIMVSTVLNASNTTLVADTALSSRSHFC